MWAARHPRHAQRSAIASSSSGGGEQPGRFDPLDFCCSSRTACAASGLGGSCGAQEKSTGHRAGVKAVGAASLGSHPAAAGLSPHRTKKARKPQNTRLCSASGVHSGCWPPSGPEPRLPSSLAAAAAAGAAPVLTEGQGVRALGAGGVVGARWLLLALLLSSSQLSEAACRASAADGSSRTATASTRRPSLFSRSPTASSSWRPLCTAGLGRGPEAQRHYRAHHSVQQK